jgi:hypothetical protein
MTDMLPPVDHVDKTKPYTDEQYALIAKLPDEDKREYMRDFQSQGWSQVDIERHYQSAHYPVIKYYSSGGGGSGSLTPPKAR